jgi:hypothetical protein
MRNLTVVATAVAIAIRDTKRFGAAEQKSAMGEIAKTSAADELIDNLTSIGNVSAVRQDLEKGGVIPSNAEPSAFSKAVKDALANL